MHLRGTQTSLMLDAARVLAAQAVCIGHAIVIFGVLPWLRAPNVPDMQQLGVIAFFLLSGFLIAYTLHSHSTNPDYGFGQYLIDRFARIYSALLPCLLIVAVIDFASGKMGTTYSSHAFFTSLLMLQFVPGPLSTFQGVAFGTAGQLWTLSIEWHLYLFVGALFFIRRSPWMVLAVAACCTVPLGYILARPKFVEVQLGLMLLWFAGFACYFALPLARRVPQLALAGVGAAALIAYAWFINPGAEFHRSSYGLLTLGFFCLVALTSRVNVSSTSGVRVVQFAAGYSFTLYLVHHSVLLAAAAIYGAGPAVAACAIVASNILAIAVAMTTEMRHRELANILKRIRRPDQVATAIPRPT